jgi:hypothetical protein
LQYGYPPPGLDVRLSIDLDLQSSADQLFLDDPGALVLLNAKTGEVLAIVSSPSFDANTMDSTWENLLADPNSPLYDRAGMGLYPPGSSLDMFLFAASQKPSTTELKNANLGDCALIPIETTLAELIKSGCKEPLNYLSGVFGQQDVITLLEKLGLFAAPPFPIETLSSPSPSNIADVAKYLSGKVDLKTKDQLIVSPLQMALAAATLSNNGELPAPRLVMSFATPQSGWTTAPLNVQSHLVFPGDSAAMTAEALAAYENPIWEVVDAGYIDVESTNQTRQGFSWYLGGTLPEWKGVSLAIAVLIEDNEPLRAQGIGRAILHLAMYP